MRFLAPLLALSLLAAATRHPPQSGRAAGPPGHVPADSAAYLLQGRVVMSDSRDPLREAEVWVEGSSARTWTDAAGHFRLRVRGADTLWVRARHLGFFPVRGAITGQRDTAITVEVGMDPMYRGFDLPPERVPTPGYVHVIP